MERKTSGIVTVFGLLLAVTLGGILVHQLTWEEPILRDPIVFFSLALPVVIAAILGLLRGTQWGRRATSLTCVFIVDIVSVILFTGPVKEMLLTGLVSSADIRPTCHGLSDRIRARVMLSSSTCLAGGGGTCSSSPRERKRWRELWHSMRGPTLY